MNHNIQNLTKTKTTLICLSTGKYEKIYLGEILKNKINYHNTDSELNQLDYRHENKDMEIKAIKVYVIL